MKALITTLLCGLILIVGCEKEPAVPPPSPPAPTVDAQPPDSVSLEDVTDTTGVYVSQQADKVAAASKAQLDAMEAKFAQLKTSAAAKGDEAQAKFAELKTSFDARVAAAEAKLAEFKEANAPRAEQIQQDLSSAMDEAGAILKDAWSRFGSGEAAP